MEAQTIEETSNTDLSLESPQEETHTGSENSFSEQTASMEVSGEESVSTTPIQEISLPPTPNRQQALFPEDNKRERMNELKEDIEAKQNAAAAYLKKASELMPMLKDCPKLVKEIYTAGEDPKLARENLNFFAGKAAELVDAFRHAAEQLRQVEEFEAERKELDGSYGLSYQRPEKDTGEESSEDASEETPTDDGVEGVEVS